MNYVFSKVPLLVQSFFASRYGNQLELEQSHSIDFRWHGHVTMFPNVPNRLNRKTPTDMLNMLRRICEEWWMLRGNEDHSTSVRIEVRKIIDVDEHRL